MPSNQNPKTNSNEESKKEFSENPFSDIKNPFASILAILSVSLIGSLLGKNLSKPERSFSESLGRFLSGLVSFSLMGYIGLFIGLILMNIISEKDNITSLCIFGIVLIILYLFIIDFSLNRNEEFLIEKRRIEKEKSESKKNIFSKIYFGIRLFGNNLLRNSVYRIFVYSVVSVHVFTFLIFEFGDIDRSILRDLTNIEFLRSNVLKTLIFIWMIYYGISKDVFRSQLYQAPTTGAKAFFLIGLFEFTKKFLVYLSGLFGGVEAFKASKRLDSLMPIEGIIEGLFKAVDILYQIANAVFSGASIPFDYKESLAFIIFSNMGTIPFFACYLLFPILLFYYCEGKIKIIKNKHVKILENAPTGKSKNIRLVYMNGEKKSVDVNSNKDKEEYRLYLKQEGESDFKENDDPSVPLWVYKTTENTCFFFALLPIYVIINEGWFMDLFYFLKSFVVLLFEQLFLEPK